jgi:cell division protein FtsW (lipid II flippase)
MSNIRLREKALLLFVLLIHQLSVFIIWQAFPQLADGGLSKLFIPPVAMFICWIITSILLAKYKCNDEILLPVMAILASIGSLFLLRIAGGAGAGGFDDASKYLNEYNRQIMWFFIGWALSILIIIGLKDYRRLANFKYIVVFAAIALLLLTTIFGHSVGGQQLVLRLGPLSFQPHDPVKALMVIFLAAYLAEKRELLKLVSGFRGIITGLDLRYLGPMLALWLTIMAIVFKHNDLGAAMLLFSVMLGMLYIGTGIMRYIAIGFSMLTIGGLAAFAIVKRVQTRVYTWLDPWADIDNKGMQISQALMAMGNGKLLGTGLGAGFPEGIPVLESDMIYAVIAEDLGFIGSVFIIAIILILVGRMMKIALRSDNDFGKMLAAGIGITLAIQAFVIIGGVVKLIPLTGIPLPFISYGGTSLVTNMVLVTLALKVAMGKKASG